MVAGIIYDKTAPRLPIISGCIIIGLTFLGANLFYTKYWRAGF
ncbi:hypothetical protein Lp19_2613 [Lactiplantibacillus plantarum]|uniref:Uncharacterized protein n=1 Tax=Lactiplantibacillus plantarum TaxID=1590 RepID=A0A165RA63_LACPN|nr:hypothetical protein Lp19_2613 [Lactiplantibacillus plantarum]